MSQALPQLPEQNSPNLVGALWRRKFLLMLFMVIGIAASYLHHRRQPPTYTTGARVLVSVDDPNNGEPNVGRSGGQVVIMGDSQSQSIPAEVERAIITSTPVLRKVVEKGRLDSVPGFQSLEWPAGVQRIRSRLSIAQMQGSSPSNLVLDLSYNSAEAEEAESVLPAVVEGYQDFLESSQVGAGERVVEKIIQAQEVLRSQLDPLEQQYREFRKNSPLIAGDKGESTNPYRELMNRVHSQMLDITVEKTKLLAEIRSLDDALKSNKDDATLMAIVARSDAARAMMQGQKETDAEVSATAPSLSMDDSSRLMAEEISKRKAELEHKLSPLLIREKTMLEQFGENHFAVKTLRTELAMTREMLEKVNEADLNLQAAIRKRQEELALAAEASRVPAQAAKGKTPRELAQLELSLLQEQMHTIEEQEAELKKVFTQHKELAAMLSQIEADDAEYRRRIERLQELYLGITGRLEEMRLFSDDSPRRVVKVLNMSEEAVSIRPNLTRNLGAGAIFGIIVGVGLALLIELTNRTFYSPEEIAENLHIPVLSHIPSIVLSKREVSRVSNSDTKISPMIITHHLPRSRYAEAFRAIRTHVLHHFKGETGKILQITSPQPSDGKSVTSCNLSVAFAQAGRRVCLLDGDLRRPTVQKLFGLNPQIGIVDVIQGRAEIQDAIIDCPVQNLKILPVGNRPTNPSELLLSNEFADLLKWLREHFDYVIIDSAPVLAVTDPTNIAPLTDAVLMAFRLRRDIRPAAQRALKVLESIGATPIGIVVNDVGDEYGGNRYGYKYNEGYSYGYRYGYGRRYSYNEYYGREPAGKASGEGRPRVADDRDPALLESTPDRN